MKLISVDLESPLPAVPAPAVGRQWVLVRLHGYPMGVLPLENRAYTSADLADLTLDRVIGSVVHHLAGDGIDWSDVDGLASAIARFTGSARSCPRRAAREEPPLTVAVCSRNGAARLPACLESLVALEYPSRRLERIVVDNAPGDDGTRRLIGERFPEVRYVLERRPGLDWARNRAIAEAHGEILAFTDDDARVDPGWAKAIARVFLEEPDAAAVTGLVIPEEIDTDAQRLFEEYGGFTRGFVRAYYKVDRNGGASAARLHAGAGKFGTGANMAFRRRVFDEIGTFDPALDVGTPSNGGGDLEMFFRVLAEGRLLVYEPAAIVRHVHRRSYAELKTQLANNGIGLYAYFVRSAAAYPDERAAFVRFGIRWFWYWSLRRLALALAGRIRFPAGLVLAELRGSIAGLWRYPRARRHAAAVARAHAGPRPSDIH